MPKIKKIENHAAGLILFTTAYVAATITVLVSEDRLLDVLGQLALVGLTVLVFMTVLFVVSRMIKRMDIIDAAWGPAFIVAAFASFVIGDQKLGINLQTLILILVSIWGLRLSLSITRRLISHDEDKRYVAIRKQWKGNEALNAYLRIFATQAALATIVSIAVIHANIAEVASPIGVLGYLGAIIWGFGFLFESVGDSQLKTFLANKSNHGKLMTKGLWSYTRHPNYFGESVMWWGIFVIVLGTTFGLVGVITPVIITYLLYFVSGVPMTEASFAGKPGWNHYKKTTSKFLPLPPKKV